MFMPFHKQDVKTVSHDWEANIKDVALETCPDDALGYRAKFYLQDPSEKSFSVGGSFLGPRAKKLETAGYTASMTRKAIALLEGQLGRSLCGAC